VVAAEDPAPLESALDRAAHEPSAAAAHHPAPRDADEPDHAAAFSHPDTDTDTDTYSGSHGNAGYRNPGDRNTEWHSGKLVASSDAIITLRDILGRSADKRR
jgi:hypothetical protein